MVGEKAVLRVLEQPYDEQKVKEVLDEATKGRGNNTEVLFKKR